MAKQRVTVYLRSDLWREFRIKCMQHGSSASETIEEMVMQYVGGKWQALLDGAPLLYGESTHTSNTKRTDPPDTAS